MRIGVVGISDGWSSNRLLTAFAERRCSVHLIEMRDVTVDLDARTATYHDLDIRELDALVIKKIGSRYSPDLIDRLNALRFLAGLGLPVFSDPGRINRVMDRLTCTVTLRLSNIPIPPTVITQSIDQAVHAVDRYGRAVLKPLYTSKARGMVLLEAGIGARSRVEQFQAAGNATLYVQKYLPLPGRDYGLVFLGGQYLGSYARVAGGGSWNTTTKSGGRYEPFDPDDVLIDFARRAQEPFGLTFTCVDVAETSNGPVVFEVSAFGGFRGLWEACRLNAADKLADYVLSRIKNGT